MTRCLRVSFSVLVLATGLSARAGAQDVLDPADAARFRFGPLRFTPSISLTSLGVDTNVFNDAENPKQDKTAAVGPAVDLWMNVGPSRVIGRVSTQYLYYDKYTNQRGWNTDYEARWELPMGRLTPYADGTYANMKSRPGYEIDSRVRLATQDVGFGTELRMSARATLVMAVHQGMIDYVDNQSVDNADLASALNNTTNNEQIKLRYRLTSLTTFIVDAQALQDRFAGDHLRNSNSIKVLPGFEMKSAALVSGKVFVGFRRFAPLNPAVPAYSGPTASVDAKFTARATQVGFFVGRDVTYSYQEAQPYYLLTDLSMSVTQRLSYTWDVIVRGGRQRLDYRQLVAVATPAVDTAATAGEPVTPLAAQLDTIQSVGFGVGYRLGRIMRFGVDVNYFKRTSNVDLREYKGLRAGASVTYGLPQ